MIPCGHWCTPPWYRYGNIFCLNFLLLHRSDQQEAPPYSQIKDWNLEWFTRHCETAGSSVCFHPSVYLSLAVYIACVCKKNVAFLMVDKSGFSQRPSIYGVGRVRLTWIAGGLLDSNWIMRGGQKSIELCCHWESMQAEWMSYTRLYCPAGHKYSPLPVDNWWQKRWLAGSQANPVQPGWKKSLWHRNSRPLPSLHPGTAVPSVWLNSIHFWRQSPLSSSSSLASKWNKKSDCLSNSCTFMWTMCKFKTTLFYSITLMIDFTNPKCQDCLTSNLVHSLYLSEWTASKSA